MQQMHACACSQRARAVRCAAATPAATMPPPPAGNLHFLRHVLQLAAAKPFPRLRIEGVDADGVPAKWISLQSEHPVMGAAPAAACATIFYCHVCSRGQGGEPHHAAAAGMAAMAVAGTSACLRGGSMAAAADLPGALRPSVTPLMLTLHLVPPPATHTYSRADSLTAHCVPCPTSLLRYCTPGRRLCIWWPAAVSAHLAALAMGTERRAHPLPSAVRGLQAGPRGAFSCRAHGLYRGI